jgi:hypothetical protein
MSYNPTNLTDTPVKTANYTAVVNDFVLTDATSGAFTVTLPTAPADKTTIGVKVVAGTMTSGSLTNSLTIAAGGSDHFNTATGPTTLPIQTLHQGMVLQYTAASSVWVVVTDSLELAQLDTRYASAGGGITRSISSISTATNAGAIAATDYVYFVSGTTTLTLPTAVGNTNRYTIKNTGAATVTVATTSSQTIDGSTTYLIPTATNSVDLVSDNANWRIV